MQVYVLTFSDGTRYVGAHEVSAKERFTEHRRRAASGAKTVLYNLWRSIGEPLMEVICDASDELELEVLESVWIEALGTIFPRGLNFAPGGKRNASSHPVVRAQFAAAKLGKKQTPEHIEARVAPRRGKKRPPEVGAKISATKRGVPQTPEAVEANRRSHTGKKQSPELVAKRFAAFRLAIAARNALR